MPNTRTWPFLSLAWFSLGQALFSFAFIYLLALGDHHLTERIPTHEHLLPLGQSVPDHTHGFAQFHGHDPGAAWSTPSNPAVVPAASATMPALLWLNDLVPPLGAEFSISLAWIPAILAVLVLANQLVIAPAPPPPIGQPATI